MLENILLCMVVAYETICFKKASTRAEENRNMQCMLVNNVEKAGYLSKNFFKTQKFRRQGHHDNN